MKAIIFDCDGVLVESEMIYKSAQYKFLDELEVIYKEDTYAEIFMGLPSEVYFKTLASHYKDQLPNGFPKGFEESFKSYCHEKIMKTLTKVPESDNFVSSLTLPFAVASSTKIDLLNHKLRMTGLYSDFAPHIYSGDMVKRGKPFPDLFLHTASKLNHKPEECVVIEDSANGVRAGVAAGMHVIGFCGGGHCSDNHESILRNAGAHETVRSYKELRSLLNL